MSQIESPVGVSLLREEIQKTYAGVAAADREFIFPTGRSWAQELGYPEPELRACPTRRSRASPAWRTPGSSGGSGSVVLDLGCGAGADLLIAAQPVPRERACDGHRSARASTIRAT